MLLAARDTHIAPLPLLRRKRKRSDMMTDAPRPRCRALGIRKRAAVGAAADAPAKQLLALRRLLNSKSGLLSKHGRVPPHAVLNHVWMCRELNCVSFSLKCLSGPNAQLPGLAKPTPSRKKVSVAP